MVVVSSWSDSPPIVEVGSVTSSVVVPDSIDSVVLCAATVVDIVIDSVVISLADSVVHLFVYAAVV